MAPYVMSDDNRSRPRRTVTLDPVTDAYLGQPEVNAGRLIDSLVESNVSDRRLKQLAEEAGIEATDTTVAGAGVEPEGERLKEPADGRRKPDGYEEEADR